MIFNQKDIISVIVFYESSFKHLFNLFKSSQEVKTPRSEWAIPFNKTLIKQIIIMLTIQKHSSHIVSIVWKSWFKQKRSLEQKKSLLPISHHLRQRDVLSRIQQCSWISNIKEPQGFRFLVFFKSFISGVINSSALFCFKEIIPSHATLLLEGSHRWTFLCTFWSCTSHSSPWHKKHSIGPSWPSHESENCVTYLGEVNKLEALTFPPYPFAYF